MTGKWTILHSIAARYSDTSSEKMKNSYKRFFELLPKVHPDEEFRIQLEECYSSFPPLFINREALVIWLCKIHNCANLSDGKETFPCTLKDLDLRWKKGVPECYEDTQSDDSDSILGDIVY